MLGALLLVAALSACGDNGSGDRPATPPGSAPAAPAPAVLAVPSLSAGDPVPAPSQDPVLTLTGRIGSTNGAAANEAASLRLDPAILDRLGRVQVTVYEPWIKHDMQFQGVWLADVIRLARPDGSAQSLHLTALDNYQIDLSMSDVMAGGVLLATKTATGQQIPVDDGGPTRIVFVGGTAAGSSADQWIWSLATIDVR